MFENVTELIYLGMRNGVSKAGEPYNVLVVGNPAKYENYEFFVSKEIVLPALMVNDPVVCTIELTKRGYNLQPTLTSVSKGKVKIS